MSETIDNDTGNLIDQKSLIAGASLIGVSSVIKQLAEHKETLGVAGKAVFELVKANPKVAAGVGLGVLTVAGVGYCVKRLTMPGTTITIGSKFKYERASKS